MMGRREVQTRRIFVFVVRAARTALTLSEPLRFNLCLVQRPGSERIACFATKVCAMLKSQRQKFSIPREVCYFNAAYMTPQPDAIVEAVAKGARFRASPWDVSASDFFSDVERFRLLVARLIGSATDDVAIVPAASYGMAIAARNIRMSRGQSILMLDEQFPSHVYPWMRLAEETGGTIVFAGSASGVDLTESVLSEIDRLGEALAIAALPNHFWANGEALDLVQIGAALRANGSALVVDITQTLGACPVDINLIQPDFLVGAGYKWLFCPYGVSVLYANPKYHDGTPVEENWINRLGSQDFSQLASYEDRYLPGARRFDVGERAMFELMPGAIGAIQQLLDWGVENISARLQNYSASLIEVLCRYGFTEPYKNRHSAHFFGVEIPSGLEAGLVGSLQSHNVYVSKRQSSLRLAPHVYNDEEDLDRFETALRTHIHSG